ncbi:MAG: dihydroorotase [Pseudomonadota bacterium]
MTIALVNARLIDPVARQETRGGLVIEGKRIAEVGAAVKPPKGAQVIDCGGHALAPGIVDMGAFALDGAAAARGGITTVALMPNLSPPVDNVAMVDYVLRLGRDDPDVRVFPLGAATKGLMGGEIAEIGLMGRAGALAFTDGRRAINDAAVMLRLLTYATTFGALIMQHAEEPSLTAGACASEGELATRLGLPAAPAYAEAMLIERDLHLVEASGARYHAIHVTTQAAITAIAGAKKRGLRVSCGVTPAHFVLNELAIGDYRTFAKLSPPLRGEADRHAVAEALAAGTIDVIFSGHDPRTEEDKRLPYAQAEAGGVGYETLLATSLKLYHDGMMDLPSLMACLTANPARLLGLGSGRLEAGAPADLVLFDPDAPWTLDADKLASAAKNSAFDGMPLQGRVRRTICDGYDAFVAG